MKKRGRALPALGAILVLAGGYAAGCGQTASTVSGETHFLGYCSASCAEGLECLCGVCTRACDDDASCSSIPGQCVDVGARNCGAPKLCDAPCSQDADCANLGDAYRCEFGTCRTGTRTPELSCDSGCRAVVGFPEDAARQCADLAKGAYVACECGEPAFRSVCQRRVSDGTLWALPEGTLAQPAAWAPCSDAEAMRLYSSCDFADCAERTGSLCSLADTCRASRCDSLELDAQGCAKASCTTDVDCAAGDRCVSTPAVDQSYCTYDATGTCGCAGLLIDVPGAFCNSIAVMGPGGAWQKLTYAEGIATPNSTWTVTPDGSVQTDKAGVIGQAQLDALTLQELTILIDGPELRRSLRDGFVCDGPPPGATVTLALTLPSGELSANVTGCVYTGPAGNVAQQISTLLRSY